MSKDLPIIARNMKKYRAKLGISQDKLSKLADITFHTITKIESGATPNPGIETVIKIANALNVSLNDLTKELWRKAQLKSIEETLWASANKLRSAVEPAEYKHVVFGLIFLKFASDKYEERREELIKEGKEKFIEMVEFYTMKNVFYLQEESRWKFIVKNSSKLI